MFAILGATGKLGRATATRLRAFGHPTRAIVRNAASAADLARLGCEIVRADVRDTASLASALAGADAVQVICPLDVHAPDARTHATEAIQSIVAALRAARPVSVLAISDYGAHVESGTGITLIFRDLEAALRPLRARLTIVRSAEHMTNWARVLPVVRADGVLPSMHQPATKLFPTVAPADVGAIAADLLREGGGARWPRIVHAEGPRRYQSRDVAAAFAATLGRDVTVFELPQAEWVPALMRGGASESYATLVAELYVAHNAGTIDVERGGEVVRGTTELPAVLASLVT